MRKTVLVFGAIVGVILILVGLFAFNPAAGKMDLWDFKDDYEEYVGGDAYNIMIEATFRAGRMVCKSLFLIGGILLLFLSGQTLAAISEEEEEEVVVPKMGFWKEEPPKIEEPPAFDGPVPPELAAFKQAIDESKK